MNELLPLYHGTRAGFRGRGGLVLPGSDVGRDNTTGSDHYRPGLAPYRADRVYLTGDLELAQRFAQLARGRGRAKVLEVLPFGPLELDEATYDGRDRDDVFTTDAALVERVVWIEES